MLLWPINREANKNAVLSAFSYKKRISNQFMSQTFIPGKDAAKDAALEDSITTFQQQLKKLGFHIEEASWLNPVPNV